MYGSLAVLASMHAYCWTTW